MKSEAQLDEEARRRAAAADGKPLEGELVDEIPGEEPQFNVDPAMMHGLMVKMVRGLVRVTNKNLKWEVEPEEEWFDMTTQALEIVVEKWFGKMATSPEALLVFNISMGWIVPNLLVSMEHTEEKKPNGKAEGALASAAVAL